MNLGMVVALLMTEYCVNDSPSDQINGKIVIARSSRIVGVKKMMMSARSPSQLNREGRRAGRVACSREIDLPGSVVSAIVTMVEWSRRRQVDKRKRQLVYLLS